MKTGSLIKDCKRVAKLDKLEDKSAGLEAENSGDKEFEVRSNVSW